MAAASSGAAAFQKAELGSAALQCLGSTTVPGTGSCAAMRPETFVQNSRLGRNALLVEVSSAVLPGASVQYSQLGWLAVQYLEHQSRVALHSGMNVCRQFGGRVGDKLGQRVAAVEQG